MHDQVVEQEVDSIFEPAGIISGKDQVESLDLLFPAVNSLSLAVLKLSIDNMLSLELIENVSLEFSGAEVLAELGSGGEGQIVRFWNHALVL
jgi:hypothetical protein